MHLRISCVLAFVLLVPAGWAQTAAVDPGFFSAKLFPVMEAAGCRNCHVHDGVASGTRLHFPEKDATASQVQSFGLSLAPLVDRADPSKSLLWNKPTNRIFHTGGERIKPGSEQDQILRQWVDTLAKNS